VHGMYALLWNVTSSVECTFIRGISLHPWNVPSSVECTFIRGMYLHPWNGPSSVECTFIRGIYLHPWNLPSSVESTFIGGIYLHPWNVPSSVECTFIRRICVIRIIRDYICDYLDNQRFQRSIIGQKSNSRSGLSSLRNCCKKLYSYTSSSVILPLYRMMSRSMFLGPFCGPLR